MPLASASTAWCQLLLDRLEEEDLLGVSSPVASVEIEDGAVIHGGRRIRGTGAELIGAHVHDGVAVTVAVERGLPSMSVGGAPALVPASIAGDPGCRWKSPDAGATNCGSAEMLPFRPVWLVQVPTSSHTRTIWVHDVDLGVAVTITRESDHFSFTHGALGVGLSRERSDPR
jgi:hypothetical protein